MKGLCSRSVVAVEWEVPRNALRIAARQDLRLVETDAEQAPYRRLDGDGGGLRARECP
jgi:hypothetical protein